MVGLQDSVGGYTITRELGVLGGVGRFEGTDADGTASLLVLAPRADVGLAARMRMLARLQVQDPGLAACIEPIDDGNCVGVAWERPGGGTLAERMKTMTLPLDLADALDLIEALVDALVVLHGQGVAHGGVGPENIWFRNGSLDSAVLVGLGSQGAAAGLTVPPELVAGEAPTPATDVFMVCALLEKLVTDPDWGQAPAKLVPVFRAGQRAAPGSRFLDASELHRALYEATKDEEEEDPDAGWGLDGDPPTQASVDESDAPTNSSERFGVAPQGNAPDDDAPDPGSWGDEDVWGDAWEDGGTDVGEVRRTVVETMAPAPAPVRSPRGSRAGPGETWVDEADLTEDTGAAAGGAPAVGGSPAPGAGNSGEGVIVISGAAAAEVGPPAASVSGNPRLPAGGGIGNKLIVGIVMGGVALGPFLFKFTMGWLLSSDEPVVVPQFEGMERPEVEEAPEQPKKAPVKQLEVRVAVDVEYAMVQVPAGQHTVGSPFSEKGRDKDEAPLTVSLPSFEIGIHEVTQASWRKVMGDNPVESGRAVATAGGDLMPCREFGVGDDLPVTCITWYEAVRYANRLSNLEGYAAAYEFQGPKVKWNRGARGYRLPTEIEWEAAARAGSDQPWGGYGIEGLCQAGPIASNRTLATWPHLAVADPLDCETDHVGMAAVNLGTPNELGLYNMLGNVAEWTWDPHDPLGVVADIELQKQKGRRTAGAQDRVVRGSSWGAGAYAARAAQREGVAPATRSYLVGLRLVRGSR